MQKNIIETIMGAVVLLVAIFFLSFAYRNSNVGVDDGYVISGRFSNAAGIALGSDVRVGGIKVGVVTDMKLDPQSYEAIISMQIGERTKLPKDSSAAIVSSGLLGEKYIQLSPGGDEAMLAEGGKIDFTQSSVNLEELIGKFVFSGGGVDKNTNAKPPADDAATATP